MGQAQILKSEVCDEHVKNVKWIGSSLECRLSDDFRTEWEW